MKKFLIKRILTSIVILIGVSIIVFTLIHMQPGNPYLNMINPKLAPEIVEKQLREMGYYDPIYIQYFKWISRAVCGDFGYSVQYKAPVFGIILKALKNTLLISIISLILSSIFAIAVGVITAIKAKSKLDYIFTGISFLGISMPTFFFALLLVKWLAYDLLLLPSSGMVSLTAQYSGLEYILDVTKHMIMPVLVLSFTQTAILLRYTRSSVMDTINQDYIRTAQAKGLTRNKAIWTHGLRNSMISIITVICMQLPTIVSGALITETVFVWPGIGTLNYNAIMYRDYMLIMGITMLIAITIIVANLLADILYAFADPRIKLEN